MLVRVGDGWYPVLETTPVVGVADMVRIRLAATSPVMSVNRTHSEDVETVRLTTLQVEALRIVSAGNLRRITAYPHPDLARPGATERKSWDRSGMPTGGAKQFERVAELGLIAIAETKPMGRVRYDYFAVTPSGRALLDLLDKEKTP